MSEEGGVTKELRKVVVSEKDVNTAALSGELIMESVGSPEEEVKFNTPVSAPFIIPSYYSCPPLFTQVSNLDAEEAN